MSFVINTRACGAYDAYLAKKGCSEDTFRTFVALLPVGANTALDPNSAKTLLQQLQEGQYDDKDKRILFIPYKEISSVSGGDARITAGTDGFPLAVEENVPVIGATIPTSYKGIYTHKQLRKLHKKNIKFYVLTDTNLILGETDSTGLLKPVSGLMLKALLLPVAAGGNGEATDITLYYEDPQSLGNNIAFAALPDNVILANYMQQIAEVNLTADTATALKAKIKISLAKSNEDITEEYGAAIAAGGSIKAYAAGATTPTVISLAYAAGEITATFTGAFTGTLVLDEPKDLITAGVGSVDLGTIAGEPISVTVAAV